MKALSASLVACVALASVVFAQAPESNDPQQEAHRQWREIDPNLERDAASAGATLGARADKVAAASAKYFSARKDYLEGRTSDARRGASLIEPINISAEALPNLDRFLSSQDSILKSTIDTIARDPDRAIQQLRASVERERAALAAISTALKDSQKSQEAAAQSGRTAEEARGKASAEYQSLATGLQESAELTDKTAAAWAGYYRALSDAARGATAPVTSSGPALPSVGRAPSAVEPVTGANPESTPAARSVPPLPLVRYIGDWTYPSAGAHYHGAQPESAELEVREDHGQASGTLRARFRVAQGSSDNPVVRFEFAGAFGSTRAQKFSVTAAGGTTGTLELIPGPAFNLLEVNFSIGDKPGMIREGNFLLIKK